MEFLLGANKGNVHGVAASPLLRDGVSWGPGEGGVALDRVGGLFTAGREPARGRHHSGEDQQTLRDRCRHEAGLLVWGGGR